MKTVVEKVAKSITTHFNKAAQSNATQKKEDKQYKGGCRNNKLR